MKRRQRQREREGERNINERHQFEMKLLTQPRRTEMHAYVGVNNTGYKYISKKLFRLMLLLLSFAFSAVNASLIFSQAFHRLLLIELFYLKKSAHTQFLNWCAVWANINSKRQEHVCTEAYTQLLWLRSDCILLLSRLLERIGAAVISTTSAAGHTLTFSTYTLIYYEFYYILLAIIELMFTYYLPLWKYKEQKKETK